MKYIFGLNLSFIFTTTPVFERKCEFSTSCFDCWCCRPEGCNPERYNGAVLSSEDRLAVEFPPAASGNDSDIGQGSSNLLPQKFVSLEVQNRYSQHINRQCLVRGSKLPSPNIKVKCRFGFWRYGVQVLFGRLSWLGMFMVVFAYSWKGFNTS